MSFLTFCLYLFCIFFRPQEWVPGILNRPVILILAITTLFLLAFERLFVNKEGFVKAPQTKMLWGLFVAVIMSHVMHTYFFGIQAGFKFCFSIYLLYFIMLNAISNSRRFRMAYWLIILLVTILVFQGMYQLHHGYGWAMQTPAYQGGKETALITRITWIGIFNDPNDLALLFVVAFGFALPFVLGKTNLLAKFFSVLAMGYLMYGVFLTNSRGGMLALMATIYFYFVKFTRKFVIGGILGGMLAFVALLFGPSRMSQLSSSESSAYDRLELWYQGILMLKSNPLFGVGYNMFTDRLPLTAHNSFVLAFAELGFVGLFFWMALIYSSYKGLDLVQDKVAKLKPYALGVQSSLIGFCAAAFFLSRTYVIIPYLMFALAGSLMYIAAQQDKTATFTLGKKELGNIFGLSIGIIIMVYVAIKGAL